MLRAIATGIVVGIGAGGTALAADRPFSFEVTAGAKYDGHLSVEEADVDRSIGDIAAVFRGRAQVRPVRSKNDEVELSYTFDQSLYAEHDEFNLQSHRLGIDASTRFGKAKLGAAYSFGDIGLGGDPLLRTHSIGPNISGFVARQLFARAYYNYIEKDFDRLQERDSEGHQAGLTINRFFNSNRSFMSVGGRFETEDAVDPALDFDGFVVSSNLRLPMGRKQGSKINVGYSYRKRDYDNITPLIAARRRENRSVFRVQAEYPLIRRLSVEGNYQYTDRNSNFPRSNYNEHSGSLALTYKY